MLAVTPAACDQPANSKKCGEGGHPDPATIATTTAFERRTHIPNINARLTVRGCQEAPTRSREASAASRRSRACPLHLLLSWVSLIFPCARHRDPNRARKRVHTAVILFWSSRIPRHCVFSHAQGQGGQRRGRLEPQAPCERAVVDVRRGRDAARLVPAAGEGGESGRRPQACSAGPPAGLRLGLLPGLHLGSLHAYI